MTKENVRPSLAFRGYNGYNVLVAETKAVQDGFFLAFLVGVQRFRRGIEATKFAGQWS